MLEIVGRGTDLYAHTEAVPLSKPRRHKKSVIRLYSTPVYNRRFVADQRGHRKRKAQRALRALADAKANRALNPNDIIGYRFDFIYKFKILNTCPLFSPRQHGGPSNHLSLRHPRENRDYEQVIYEQIAKWVRQGATEVTPLADEDLAGNVYLKSTLEPLKPRYCCNGSHHITIGVDQKLPCKLDDIRTVLSLILPGDYLTKVDDKVCYLSIILYYI